MKVIVLISDVRHDVGRRGWMHNDAIFQALGKRRTNLFVLRVTSCCDVYAVDHCPASNDPKLLGRSESESRAWETNFPSIPGRHQDGSSSLVALNTHTQNGIGHLFCHAINIPQVQGVPPKHPSPTVIEVCACARLVNDVNAPDVLEQHNALLVRPPGLCTGRRTPDIVYRATFSSNVTGQPDAGVGSRPSLQISWPLHDCIVDSNNGGGSLGCSEPAVITKWRLSDVSKLCTIGSRHNTNKHICDWIEAQQR